MRGEMSAPDSVSYHPQREGAGLDAGDLRGCVGVLAALSRGGGRGRLHHHPHPAVLGGFPIPVARRPRHVDAIRRQVAAAFPDREHSDRRVRVAERRAHARGRRCRRPPTRRGPCRRWWRWPSARTSGVNLIEAFDQPWKRQLEGAVGGHWGMFDAYSRKAKFAWGRRSPTIRLGAGRRRSVSHLPPCVFAAAWPMPRGPQPTLRRDCGWRWGSSPPCQAR